MMRRYLVAGNWKLNMGPKEGRQLAADLHDLLKGRDLKGDVLVCPPFVSIPAVGEVAKGDPVQLGAQNCASEAGGAYTGEVSAQMLAEAGVRYVIVAHSERRQYQRETDDLFVKKIDLIHEVLGSRSDTILRSPFGWIDAAFPVTVDETGHRLGCSTGERLDAA